MTSIPRNDERNAINNIINHLKTQLTYSNPSKICFEPNGPKTAPDWSIEFCEKSVLVEITNSGDGFLTMSDGTCKPRLDYEYSAVNMIRKVNSYVRGWIGQTETILLSVLSPIPPNNRGRIAKKIATHLEKIYNDRSLTLDQTIHFSLSTSDIEISSIHLEATLLNSYAGKESYTPLKSVLGATMKSPNPGIQVSLSEQARFILQSVIDTKSKKLTHLSGEKWLAIINTHPLLDINIYHQTFLEISKENSAFSTSFEKLFILCDGKVEVITDLNQNCGMRF